MPLLDHFHRPLKSRAPWTSICSYWVVAVSKWLNSTLPVERFRAFAHVALGTVAEADVAEYESDGDAITTKSRPAQLRTARIPPAVLTIEPSYPDEFEVKVMSLEQDDMTLSAVIEFISESNKDRSKERLQLVNKCLSYLYQGVGVVLVDVVTKRRANLHNKLLSALGENSHTLSGSTYVSSYRPVEDGEKHTIDIWPYKAMVGKTIPSVPLPLRSGPQLMIDFESTYMECVRDHGI